MALKRITEEEMNAQGVIAAPDILNGTPAQNKAIFDRMVRSLVAPAVNACVDAVEDVGEAQEEVTKNEAERVSNEVERIQAEQNRTNEEQTRTEAEADRVEEENVRVIAERNRVTAENERTASENARVNAEADRSNAEADRDSAEQERDRKEQERVDAEEARASEFATLKTNAETATNSANTAADKVNMMTVSATDLAPGSDATVTEGVNENGGIDLKFGIPEGVQGETGNGIESINKTGGTGAAGTYDTYTITMTDGSKFNFQVLNGANGKDGDGTGDMVADTYDPQGKRTDIFAYVEEHGGVQSDWNENDPESKAYVKNRTHYSESHLAPVSVEVWNTAENPVSEFVNTELEFTDGVYKLYDCGIQLDEGSMYRIVWDSVIYERECVYSYDDEYLSVGNPENGDAFCVEAYDGAWWGTRLRAYDADGNLETGTTTHTISIYEVAETVHKLDAKYLPDGVKIFWVPFHYVDEEWLCDVSCAEIIAAENAGCYIVGKTENYVMPWIKKSSGTYSYYDFMIQYENGSLEIVEVDMNDNITSSYSAVALLEDVDTKIEAAIAEIPPAYTYGPDDLTAGSSPLATGQLHFVYE